MIHLVKLLSPKKLQAAPDLQSAHELLPLVTDQPRSSPPSPSIPGGQGANHGHRDSPDTDIRVQSRRTQVKTGKIRQST